MTPIVYLDMDGVIVDFVGGALRLLGLPEEARDQCVEWGSLADIAVDYGLCPAEGSHAYVWDRINAAGVDFWADLATLPTGMVLLTRLLTAGIPLAFVTASSRHHTSAAGKQLWLEQNLPHDAYQGKPLHRRFAICPAKHLLAHRDALLVDDRPRNIDLFQKHGGVGMLWPQRWSGWPTADLVGAQRQQTDAVLDVYAGMAWEGL